MSEPRVRNYRAIEILDILRNNGPLSFKGIAKLVNPPMTEHKLRLALIRLNKKHLLKKRNEKIFGGHGTFYQIPQTRDEKEMVAEYLQMPVHYLDQPDFRYRELVHNEDCALWMSAVKHLLPDAVCIRDFEFDRNLIAKKIMSLEKSDIDLKPDFIFVLKNDSERGFISIAIEIEKSRKSDERLIRKLYKYASASHVDGVIYVCESIRIKEVLQHIYTEKILHESKRIEHYPRNFFLFSNTVDNCFKNDIELFNSHEKAVSLVNWTHYLQNTSFNQRRDYEIDNMGRSPSPYSNKSI